MYSVESDVLLMAAFVLTLILMGMIGTRKQREQGEPPRWMEQANGDLKASHLRRIRGYDPTVTSRIGYDVKTVDLGRL